MTRHDEPQGRYVGRDAPGGDRELWWAPPDSSPWERLHPLLHRSPDGPNWGYDGNGPTDAAEAILLHATGDASVAAEHARRFSVDHLVAAPGANRLELPLADVADWLDAHGIPLAPGWNRHGPQPLVDRRATGERTERYTVSLDGWDLVRIDVDHDAPTAHVGVGDLRGTGELRWAQRVAIADEGDQHAPLPPGQRVTVDPLPFGGWALQVDEFDVAILERDHGNSTDARVAVYDRAPAGPFLAFDERVRYRQLPSEPVAIGELLRRFSGTADRERVLGR